MLFVFAIKLVQSAVGIIDNINITYINSYINKPCNILKNTIG